MDLRPVVFSQQNTTSSTQSIEDMNKLYSFFLYIWNDTWKELKIEKTSHEDDFYRFDMKVGFFLEEKPIAFHGYSFFDLRLLSDRQHSYFRKLPVPLAEKLIEKKLFRVATMEYMAVDPKFRKVSDHYVGDLLGGFSTQFLKRQAVDVVLGIARNDRGVNDMCLMYGGKPAYENVDLHHVMVDVMIFEPLNIKENPNFKIKKLVRNLIATAELNLGVKVAA